MRSRATQQGIPPARSSGASLSLSWWQRSVFGFMVLLGLFGFLFGPQMLDEYYLSQNAQPTKAQVVSKTPGHGWIEYEYRIDGNRYKGQTSAATTGKSFEKIEVGDPLIVLFDPTHPSISGTTETRAALTSTAPFLAAITIIVGALFLMYVRHRSRD